MSVLTRREQRLIQFYRGEADVMDGEPDKHAALAETVRAPRAERFEMEGLSVAIVRKADLIALKERAAVDPAPRKSKRLRDQADIELLRGDVPDPDEGW